MEKSKKIFIKGDYKAIEHEDTNYYELKYNGHNLLGDEGVKFSLKFILDMGFELQK